MTLLIKSIFCVLLLLSTSSYALEGQQEVPKDKIKFFRPFIDKMKIELYKTKKSKLKHVLITGKSRDLEEISLFGKKIVVVKNKRLKYFNTNSAIPSKNKNDGGSENLFTKDYLGFFKVSIKLPTGIIHLPLKAKFKDGTSQKYVLKFDVLKLSVKSDVRIYVASPLIKKNNGLWLGFGFNTANFSQDASGGLLDLSFESNSSSSIFLSGFHKLNKEWEINGTYNNYPSKTESSPDVVVKNSAYNWTTLYLGALWHIPKIQNLEFTFLKKRYFINYALLLGSQVSSAPFFTRTSEAVNLSTNSIHMVSLGGMARWTTDNKWVYEALMRLQYPIYAGDLFSVDSSQSVNGSLGFYYKYNENLRFGGYWFAHMQKMNYSRASDELDTNYSGSQSLRFSNIEFRVGYHW